MTASLTPTLALDFITALSADIRAAAVLDAAGEPLAGPPRLAAAARPLARGEAGARGSASAREGETAPAGPDARAAEAAPRGDARPGETAPDGPNARDDEAPRRLGAPADPAPDGPSARDDEAPRRLGAPADPAPDQALAGSPSAAPWSELEGGDGRGKVFVARDERHVIVVVTGPFALARVTRHDLRTALSALGGQNVPIGPPGRLEEGLARALLDVAGDDFRRPRAKKRSDLEP
jgi:hypothetical protein